MKLRWTERATADLIAVYRDIALDNPRAAKDWVAKLRQRARCAADTPLTGRIVPEFGRPDIREVFLGNYRIVYRIADDRVTILTVFEGHRLLHRID